MEISILFEDTQLLVINKPFGIVVNRAETVKEPTIQDWMEEKKFIVHSSKLVEEQHEFLNRSGVVHRLDKETSGCLILAKTAESFFVLQASFKERLVKKKYLALVHGKLVPENGEINVPVGRLPWNRQQFGVAPGGKDAHTAYTVSAYYTDAEQELYTLVDLYPTTGRTHQLRVHMKYLGFPIVGDYLYAGRKQQLHDRVWCPRVFLHAAEVSFPHPVSQEMIQTTADLPIELTKVLGSLTKI